MFRIALAAGLATYLALATGETSTFANVGCTQRCPDDDSDGKCAPDCADCACCPHLRIAFAVVEVKAPVAGRLVRIPVQHQEEPASPEPGEILHVPRHLVAQPLPIS